MPTLDQRVDIYIEKSNDFAKPILIRLRKVIHKACPEAKETIKWGFPAYEYKGILCGMAAFKAHCAFNLWKFKLIKDTHGLIEQGERTAMGFWGKITSVKDLPKDEILIEYIKQAMFLNEMGIKPTPQKRSKEKVELIISDDFKKALNKNKTAKAIFEAMSYSHKKEYIEYIDEAKREETRKNRIEKSIEKINEGKNHNWKYEKR